MQIIICIFLYIILSAIFTFALLVGSVDSGAFEDGDFPWPVVCGIFWPLAGPIAAAFIVAVWYLNHK